MRFSGLHGCSVFNRTIQKCSPEPAKLRILNCAGVWHRGIFTTNTSWRFHARIDHELSHADAGLAYHNYASTESFAIAIAVIHGIARRKPQAGELRNDPTLLALGSASDLPRWLTVSYRKASYKIQAVHHCGIDRTQTMQDWRTNGRHKR
jgi:hypothetical protein